MFLLMGLLGSTAFACDEPLTLTDANQYLKQSVTALENMDATQAGLLLKSIGNTLNCMNEPVSQEFASQYFIMQGILIWAAGEQDVSARYFSAAKNVQPDIKISTAIFPETHEIHTALKYAPKSPETIEVTVGEGEKIYFDGTESLSRPVDRPTIYQLMDSSGSVVSTKIIDKGEDLPNQPKPIEEPSAPTAPTPVEEPVVLATEKDKNNTLLWVSMGFGAATATSGALATQKFIEYNNAPEGADLAELETENNIYFITTCSTGLVTLVTGLLWLGGR